ncbi:MAG: hypothetical protein J1F36_05025 [Clostridiales bacterium]|nr:hypothetical protein [Clostridiales bacterium]
MIGITAYHCFRKQTKVIVYNFVVLFIFILIKVAEVHYITIRTELYEFLGEELFATVKELISAMLFFGTSITVGVQLLSDFASIIVFVILAAKAAKFIVRKCSKCIYAKTITPENEKVEDRHNKPIYRSYLLFSRLIN